MISITISYDFYTFAWMLSSIKTIPFKTIKNKANISLMFWFWILEQKYDTSVFLVSHYASIFHFYVIQIFVIWYIIRFYGKNNKFLFVFHGFSIIPINCDLCEKKMCWRCKNIASFQTNLQNKRVKNNVI